MRKFINHSLNFGIDNNVPFILLEVHYKDDFTDDKYVLKTENSKATTSKNLLFEVYKNNELECKLNMVNRNVTNMLNEFINQTNDADFNTTFEPKIIDIESEVEKFLTEYDNRIQRRDIITLEGEIKRMQRTAGILVD